MLLIIRHLPNPLSPVALKVILRPFLVRLASCPFVGFAGSFRFLVRLDLRFFLGFRRFLDLVFFFLRFLVFLPIVVQ